MRVDIDWEKEKENILKMRENHMSFDNIALEYGVSRSTIQRQYRYVWQIKTSKESPNAKYDWDKHKDNIIRWKAEGLSYDTIAARIGIPSATIQYRCTNFWNIRGRNCKIKQWTEEEIQLILQLLDEGKTYVEITRELKVSGNRLKHILRHDSRLKAYLKRRADIWQTKRNDIREALNSGFSDEGVMELLSLTKADIIYYRKKSSVKSSGRWSREEITVLTELIEGSNLTGEQIQQYWEKHHQYKGWPRRTLAAIQYKAHKLGLYLSLGERGLHHTRPDLCKILGISEARIRKWMAHGYLKSGKETQTDTPMRYQIETKEVVRMALNHPYEITPYLSPEAYAWLLHMMNDYVTIRRTSQQDKAVSAILHSVPDHKQPA